MPMLYDNLLMQGLVSFGKNVVNFFVGVLPYSIDYWTRYKKESPCEDDVDHMIYRIEVNEYGNATEFYPILENSCPLEDMSSSANNSLITVSTMGIGLLCRYGLIVLWRCSKPWLKEKNLDDSEKKAYKKIAQKYHILVGERSPETANEQLFASPNTAISCANLTNILNACAYPATFIMGTCTFIHLKLKSYQKQRAVCLNSILGFKGILELLDKNARPISELHLTLFKFDTSRLLQSCSAVSGLEFGMHVALPFIATLLLLPPACLLNKTYFNKNFNTEFTEKNFLKAVFMVNYLKCCRRKDIIKQTNHFRQLNRQNALINMAYQPFEGEVFHLEEKKEEIGEQDDNGNIEMYRLNMS